ncbi:MAG: Gfo/Idh/MocA family oxidoreductase [bacterium]|nr:Gfo/Idh/MocA family oxidoreductase [bacterium]
METKVIRFGVIGTENSHVNQACKRFNVEKTMNGAFVEALYPGEGDTLEHVKQVQEQGKVPLLVDKPEDMLGKVDAIIIMNRHAKYHARYAKLFLKNKIPTFIDKPITCDLEEAKELIELSHQTNTWLSSWSSVWQTSSFQNFFKQTVEDLGPIHSGMVGGPFDFKSEYGGVFFYGIHTVEMLLNGFGYDVKTISARLYGKNCWVTAGLQSEKVVSLHLLGEGKGEFQVLVHCEKGSRHLIVDSSDGYDKAFKKLIDTINSNENPLTDKELLMPVKVLLAIDKSVRNNEEVKI